MSSKLDSVELPITCKQCGNVLKKTIGWIKANPQFPCSCGFVIRFSADELAAETGKIDRQIRAFESDLKDFGKS